MEKNVYLKTKSHHLTPAGRLFIRLLCIYGMPENAICLVARVRVRTVHAVTAGCAIGPAVDSLRRKTMLRRAGKLFEIENRGLLTYKMAQQFSMQVKAYVHNALVALSEKGQAVAHKCRAELDTLTAQAVSLGAMDWEAFAETMGLANKPSSARERAKGERSVAKAVTANLAGSWGRSELTVATARPR